MHLRKRVLRTLSFLGTFHRYAISLTVGLIAAIATARYAGSPAEIIVGWDAFALSMLLIAWARIVSASPAVVLRVAQVQHVNRIILLFLMVGGACASLGAVAILLSKKAANHPGAVPKSVLLAIATVVCSWLLVHTIFTLHYAYLYYRVPNSRRVQPKPHALLFPGQGEPDYFDFAYFSFIIGMTSQVSDVGIGCREIRRWALLHGLIAFVFNVCILGVSVNVISGIFGPG